jgi:hypothetical protein
VRLLDLLFGLGDLGVEIDAMEFGVVVMLLHFVGDDLKHVFGAATLQFGHFGLLGVRQTGQYCNKREICYRSDNGGFEQAGSSSIQR